MPIILQGTLPAYCIPKVVRLKTGEYLYERPYLSPRPPPKISLRTRSRLDQRESSIGFYSWTSASPVNSFNSLSEKHHVLNSPNQPQSKPNPICDRSVKLEDTERVFVDKGKTSRSQEIDDKRLHKELGSSDRTGELVKSSASTHIVKEQFCSRRTSWHCIIQREQRVQPWNNYMAPTFKNWFRRSRITLNEKHFKVIFNNDNSTLSAKNHKTWLKQLETLNCVKLLDVEPKAQCKASVVLGRQHRLLHVRSLLTRWYDREIRSSSIPFLTSSLFRTFTSGKVNHTVTGTERKKVIKNITLRINSKRSVRNDNSWAFTIDSFVIHGSEKPCWNWVALRKWFARWTN